MAPELILFARYNYNDQVKEDEMNRACKMHGKNINAYRILVGKLDGQRSL
jgi:hypothetical protein